MGITADARRRRGDRRRPAVRHKKRAPVNGIPSHARHAKRHLAWYVGLTLMAVFEVIEWPVALVIGVGHALAHRAHTEVVRDLAEGIEAGG